MEATRFVHDGAADDPVGRVSVEIARHRSIPIRIFTTLTSANASWTRLHLIPSVVRPRIATRFTPLP
jgi:hypothetical protein